MMLMLLLILYQRQQYLYLLFDDQNALNHDGSNGVFNTEGHYLSLDKSYLRPPPKSRKGETQVCRPYIPKFHTNSSKSLHALQTGIPFRSDMEYARALVNLPMNEARALNSGIWDIYGSCEVPTVEVIPSRLGH